MHKKTMKITESASEYANEIFEAKKRFHKEQAKLPIEEKIKILIELQKIIVKIQRQDSKERNQRVWKI